ncbi:FERM domain-containing protein 4A isoform X6 [Prionailurus iriomotensis]
MLRSHPGPRQTDCAWESETMAVQLVPDSALSLLM